MLKDGKNVFCNDCHRQLYSPEEIDHTIIIIEKFYGYNGYEYETEVPICKNCANKETE